MNQSLWRASGQCTGARTLVNSASRGDAAAIDSDIRCRRHDTRLEVLNIGVVPTWVPHGAEASESNHRTGGRDRVRGPAAICRLASPPPAPGAAERSRTACTSFANQPRSALRRGGAY